MSVFWCKMKTVLAYISYPNCMFARWVLSLGYRAEQDSVKTGKWANIENPQLNQIVNSECRVQVNTIPPEALSLIYTVGDLLPWQLARTFSTLQNIWLLSRQGEQACGHSLVSKKKFRPTLVEIMAFISLKTVISKSSRMIQWKWSKTCI